MSLPLLKRATEDGVTFVLTPARTATALRDAPAPRMPLRAPGPGRAVPLSRRHGQMHRLQMLRRRLQRAERQPRGDQLAARERDRRRLVSARRALVHVDRVPSLPGADVSAGLPGRRLYEGRGTGIVLHSADACIGCQYCTWNCSYGVPQYNPERGVVGKCDMCHGGWGSASRRRACLPVPSGAIQIEIVNVKSWRARGRPPSRPAAGVPSGDQSVSTTRITLPANLPPNASRSISCTCSPAIRTGRSS